MKKYGLVGHPLSHSFSKKHFNEKFNEEKIDAEYLNFDLDQITKFPEIFNTNNNVCGLNVTIPYKEKVIEYLDDLDEVAQAIGAVNTIKVVHTNRSVQLKGFNTDAYGFIKSIEPHLKPIHKKALILGTGGASKAIVWALKQRGIETHYVSRSKKENTFTYDELNQEIIDQHKVIVNCTPLGTYPNNHTSPNLPYEHLTNEHLLFDLVYNPEITVFLQHGIDCGAMTLNGHQMLMGQAEKAWDVWNQE